MSTPGGLLLTDEERDWLEAHPVIRVAQDPSRPPMEYATDAGEFTGISGEYLRLIEERLGITFERVRGLEWQEAYERLQRWEIDMTTSVAETPPRHDYWVFTKPYMNIPVVIVTHSNVTYVAGVEELIGHRVAAVTGHIASERIAVDFPGVELVAVKSIPEGLELLRRGEVFAVVGNMLVIGYHRARLRDDDFKIAGETPYVNAQSMAVRKDWAILAGILQKALDSITVTERAAIYRKWVPIRYAHGFDYHQFWRTAGVFTVVLALLGLWIHRLTKEIRSRKAAEASLLASESRARFTLRAAMDGFLRVDAQGHLLEVNQAYCQMSGYSEEELIGMQVSALEARDSPARIAARVKEIVAHGAQRFETWHRRKDGSQFAVEISVQHKPEDGGRHVAFLRDITERKLAEDERQRLQAQLMQAQKMESVGRLAGGVAHDFNNVLAVILGHVEMAKENLPVTDPLHADLMQIQKAAERSADLTRQLLAFARKQAVIPKVLDLNETVDGMLTMLRRLIGEHIELVWRPGAHVWPVRIDPSQIDQILANLCVNARDAITDVGQVTIETESIEFDDIYCEGHADCLPGTYALLAVSDTGCGMDKRTLANMFEPFFTTKETGKGTGLGLATVYGIVKQNDGFVNVYSEPGRGTTFKIYLPRHVGPAEQALPRSEGAEGERGSETILLVEDEPAILDLTTKMLRRQGYTVLAASSPGEALRQAQVTAGPIHLLMTDVVMPEMNGRDLAARLVSSHAGLRCLFMSGYTADVIAHQGVLDAGVHFVQKPFSRKTLATTIRAVLDERPDGEPVTDTRPAVPS